MIRNMKHGCPKTNWLCHGFSTPWKETLLKYLVSHNHLLIYGMLFVTCMGIKTILPGFSRSIVKLPAFTKKTNLLFNCWVVLKTRGMNWKCTDLTLQMPPYYEKGLRRIKFFSYWRVSVQILKICEATF